MLRWLSSCLFFAFAMGLCAQNTTVINHFEGDTSKTGLSDMLLQHSEEHVVIINYYSNASNEEENRLHSLLTDALYYYLDQSIIIEKDEVKLRKSPKKMKKEMDAIVADGLRYYSFREKESFKGFTPSVLIELDDLENLNWKNNLDHIAQANGIEGRSDEENAYLYVQGYLSEVKLQVEKELGFFTEGNMMALVAVDSTAIAKEQAELLEEVQNFEKHDQLKPISLDFSLNTMNLLASAEDVALPSYQTPPAPAAPLDDFSERILALLEANNARMTFLEEELLRMKKKENEVPPAVQQQLDEIRGMVASLASDDERITPLITPTTNLPEAVNIYFKKGGVQFDLNAEFMISELTDILIKNPRLRVVVTGYADSSGDEKLNLLLSKSRAERIQHRILDSGVDKHRVMVNFFGDREASGNPDKDRKVVVEFIQY